MKECKKLHSIGVWVQWLRNLLVLNETLIKRNGWRVEICAENDNFYWMGNGIAVEKIGMRGNMT